MELKVGDKIGIFSKICISQRGYIKLKARGLKDSKQKFIRTLGIAEEILDFGKIRIKVKFSLEECLEAGELVYCDSGILHLMSTESYEGTLKILSGSNIGK